MQASVTGSEGAGEGAIETVAADTGATGEVEAAGRAAPRSPDPAGNFLVSMGAAVLPCGSGSRSFP